jgi:hypothetical protein
MKNEDFNFNLQDIFGNSLAFTSLDELESFIEHEREEWQWLNQEGVGIVHMSGRVSGHFETIMTWIQQYKDEQIDSGTLGHHVYSLYNRERPPLLLSDFQPGATIGLIKEELGSAQADLALSLLTGHSQLDFQQLQHVRLWHMLALPAAIQPNAWAAAERNKLANARVALGRQLTAHRKKIEAQQNDLKTLNTNARMQYRSIAASALRIASRRAEIIKDAATASIERINATDVLFNEQMKLKAPVGYWNDKKEKHRKAAIYWAFGFVIYIFLSMFLGVFLFEKAWMQATGEFTGKHFLLVAGLGTALTLIFWISRVLMRIFLGEMHLYTDAVERRVMTQTYLSLIKEGGATESERALILTALFRSAQDGIVREEAGGEVGIAAVAAKLLEPRR